jgi:hypothetical protein
LKINSIPLRNGKRFKRVQQEFLIRRRDNRAGNRDSRGKYSQVKEYWIS